jgi:hypothetical protein
MVSFFNKNKAESQTEYRKAFGQFSSLETQRITTLEPIVIQLDSQEEAAGGTHSIHFDGGDIIIRQNTRRVLTNSHEKDVISMNVVADLNKDDLVQIIMSAETDNEGLGIEVIEPEGEPTSPSIIVTIVQLD